tara:strand:+ start:383 stop:835 length:453 start_codon:yes stop_codon:yes gene_type:complete
MIKKKIFLILIIFLSSCGYNPIYLKKIDTEVIINSYQLVGDKNINRSIISHLGIKNNENTNAKYNLKLNSTKLVEVVAKDKEGNTSVFKTTITVKLLISEGNSVIKERTFVSSFVYNNTSNKFDLFQYQKNIDKNLIKNLSEKIFIFLTI